MVARIFQTRVKNHARLPDCAAPEAPALAVEGLSAAYGDKEVLRDIHFQMPPGTILALIGPNGAGKSSLIRTLSGVLPLRSGRVCVNGQNLAECSILERAQMLAVVPQARNLPPAFSAWEMVALGRTPHLNWLGQISPQDEAVVRQAMLRTHTLELESRPVGELSGGEQQRLMLARALAQAAPVLLLDEPTTHLDLKYQFSLLDQVRGLVRQDNLTVVVALHDLNLVMRYADQVALLVAGKMRAFGRPKEVLTPALLSDAYDLPLQIVELEDGQRTLILPAML
jgi:ABC-type cobalamin/Fe3+-siderophores transport system ATPase subunit